MIFPCVAYRELAKTDKSKKGSANLNNAQASGPTAASAFPNVTKKKPGTAPDAAAAQQNAAAPVPLKPRDKTGKAAGPAAGDVDVHMHMGESVSAAGGIGHSHPDAGDVEDQEALVEDDDMEDQHDGDDHEEDEELVDTMQVEEEELRGDAVGVEERSGE
ncbi:hypothetical protein AX15_002034 [Amanita polypyramis BW_CC]|nr:hypothetical protein AX15_002034 [Amanita polypyramis BW_CC]